MTSLNVVWQGTSVTRARRWRAIGQRGATVWFTGLPAAGKSTLAARLESRLIDAGRSAYVLDGDNLRHGLCGDLGFDRSDREENIRRTGEVACLFADAGTTVLVALVSPYRSARQHVRETHERCGLPFVEVFVNTPLQACEARDPKRLYARARAGLLDRNRLALRAPDAARRRGSPGDGSRHRHRYRTRRPRHGRQAPIRKPENRRREMKVIGVGLPRTATLTQKVALEMLGFGPCYHMVNVLADLKLVPLWRDALEGRPDWERIFDGFEATVDWPGGFYYRELAERYPEAKLVLSVRDPEAWERSMRSTVWGVYHGDSLIRHLSSAAAIVDPDWHAYLELMNGMLWDGRGTLAARHQDHGGLMEAMQRHTEAVRQATAPERLLVWDAAEGWDPLCAFLGVDVPAAPLPRLNDSESFAERVVDMSLGTLNGWRERASEPVPATTATV